MKKVLFATTALVATAGVASAEVAVSGSAEMGVAGGSGGTITQFFQDIDVTFTLSGETDGGIAFGAAVDLDEIAGGATGATRNDFGTAVFISGDFGTLTLGDTDGGFDAGMQEVNIGSPGSIADDETAHAGYNGNAGLDGLYDGQVLSYSYSVSGFTITGSIEMDDDGNPNTFPVGAPTTSSIGFNVPVFEGSNVNGDGLTGDAVYGIGASYTGTFGGGSFTVGGGYQTVNDVDAVNPGAQGFTVTGISATVALDSGLSAGVNYSMIDVSGLLVTPDYSGVHTAIGASYTFDNITVHANYGMYDWDPTAYVADTSGFGLAAEYDLGNGLAARLGYGSSSIDALNMVNAGHGVADLGGTPVATGTSSTWSLGVAMSF